VDHPDGEDQMMGDANLTDSLVPKNWPFNRSSTQLAGEDSQQ